MPSPALALLVLAYPLAVYFGLLYLPPRSVALAVAALFSLRLWLMRRRLSAQAGLQLYPAFALAIACALASVVLGHAGALRLIPVIINASGLVAFAFTLWKPPSMIERFARLAEPELPDSAIAYTRRVTWVWCGFFVVNGSIALYTALYASLAQWTLYNGLIAYVLMGLLFGVEYAVRLRVKARHGGR